MTEETIITEGSVDNAQENNFREMLPEQYKGMYPEFKKPEDFVKSYDELYRKMGSSINQPKEDSPQEDWDKFYNKLGRPESADKYDFQIDENTKVDDEFLGKFRSKAHELGVSQKQAKEMFNWYNKESSEVEARYTQESEDSKNRALADLKVRWGNKYDEKLTQVQRFAKDLIGTQEGYEKIEKYGNDPDFIELLYNVNNKYNKEEYISPTNQVYVDKPDLLTEAKKLMGDKDYKYNEAKQARVRSMYQEVVRQNGAKK